MQRYVYVWKLFELIKLFSLILVILKTYNFRDHFDYSQPLKIVASDFEQEWSEGWVARIDAF